MARLTPTTGFIETIENSLEPKEAVSELIDNAIDAGATRIDVQFGGDYFQISDNGSGVSDMNAPFKLGVSLSKGTGNKIGRYGYGGKAGLLHFGREILLRTVYRNVYREFEADFSDNWPEEYSGSTLPINRAHEFISNGGSIFTVAPLTKGRRRIVLDPLADELSIRYFPALKAGKEISLWNDKSDKFVPLRSDVMNLLSPKTTKGFAAGKPFSLYYGDPKEANKYTGKIHVDYQSSRTLFSVAALPNIMVHPRVYIRLTLGAEWSDCLAPDKTRLCKHADELMEAAETILRPWLEEFRSELEELRLDLFHQKLSQKTPRFFAAKGTGFTRTQGSGKGGPPHPPHPNPQNRVKPDPDGKSGAEEGDAPKCCVKYGRDDTLGECAARTVKDGNDLMVLFNGTVPMIDAAYCWPYKEKILFGVAAAELAGYFRRTPEECGRLIPEVKELLGNDRHYGDVLQQKIFWWLLSQCPNISETEINKAMA